VRDKPLGGDVVLVEADIGRGDGKGRTVSPGGRRCRGATSTSTTRYPPSSRCRAALRKQSTCWSWVVRFLIVLNTR
jgi:hypothetical protein